MLLDRLKAMYKKKVALVLTALLVGVLTNTAPALAAGCGSGISPRELTIVEMKAGSKPKIDAGILFQNAVMNNKVALNALHRCAANNDPEAMAFLGLYYSGKDDVQSLQWYLRADAGGKDVGCNIAKKYDLGEGVKPNAAEAAKWYLKSADHGDAGCQYNLGLLYLDGRGVPKSMANTVQWWRKAATQGHPDAQYNLGLVYEKGDGVPVDKGQSAHFYLLACQSKNPKGCYSAGVQRFNGDGVPQNKDQGVTLIRMALKLDPNYERAKNALKQIGLKP